MSKSPRDWEGALKYAQGQSLRPTEDWEGYCQKFVRSCYQIGPLFNSAWDQWLGLHPDDKHSGGKPSDAPIGAALFYKGSGKFGHIMLAARPFKDGTPAAWSNDLVEWGAIDKVARTAPTSAWNQNYLGWSSSVNGVDLRLKPIVPARPGQTKKYGHLSDAIDEVKLARAKAAKLKDAADVARFDKEIVVLKKMYAEMRHK